jgi:hypothetical protein
LVLEGVSTLKRITGTSSLGIAKRLATFNEAAGYSDTLSPELRSEITRYFEDEKQLIPKVTGAGFDLSTYECEI